jgi:hypothetical protein
LATGSFSETFHNDLFRLVAPLSTFCCLYNLFLLAILDEEFIKGEAIFSKMDLIKMSSLLKDSCVGLIVLMHPDQNFNNSVSFYVTPEKDNLSRSIYTNSSNMELKTKAKYFTHLFNVSQILYGFCFAIFDNKLIIKKKTCCQLVQRIYTRDIRRSFCPEDHWISNSKFIASNRLSSILKMHDQSILTQVKFGRQSYLFQEGCLFL